MPRGDDPPYVVDDYKVYVRNEVETELAVRDEIVSLVLRGQRQRGEAMPPEAVPPAVSAPQPVSHPVSVEPPRTGVEVVSVEERDGMQYYTMQDLRNGNVVKNVTNVSARRLWHYAIKQYARRPADLSKMQWDGDLGLLRRYKEGKNVRYDLIQRTPQAIRYYFGVTEDGIHSSWKRLVGVESGSDDD